MFDFMFLMNEMFSLVIKQSIVGGRHQVWTKHIPNISLQLTRGYVFYSTHIYTHLVVSSKCYLFYLLCSISSFDKFIIKNSRRMVTRCSTLFFTSFLENILTISCSDSFMLIYNSLKMWKLYYFRKDKSMKNKTAIFISIGVIIIIEMTKSSSSICLNLH